MKILKIVLFCALFLVLIISLHAQVIISPANPNDNDNLICTLQRANPSLYIYKWYLNGNEAASGSTLPNSMTSPPHTWKCKVYAPPTPKTGIVFIGEASVNIDFDPIINDTITPPPNNLPVITSAPVTIGIVGINYIYDVNANDADGNTLTYSLTTKPSGMIINSATGLMSWTPSSAENYNIIVSVTDGKAVVTQTFTITVSAAPNSAPVLASIGNKVVNEGQILTIILNATDSDGNPLSYSATGIPSGASFNSGTKTFTWTPGYTSSGNYPVTFSVTDGTAADSETINIQVFNVNRAPAITSGPPTTAMIGILYSYDVNANDADGDTLTYSLTTAPIGMTINSANGLISWTPTSSQLGANSVVVSVTDGIAAVTQIFTITVSTAGNNTAPTITSTPLTTAIAGAAYSYDVNANDLDGNTLTYSLTTKPAGMTINSVNGLISWMPSSAETFNIVVSVTDGKASITQSYSITVSAAPDTTPPIISSVTAAGITNESATITFNTNEAANDVLTCSIIKTDFSFSTSHIVSLTKLNPNTNYTYTIRVCDISNNCVTSPAFNFRTNNNPVAPNQPPVITSTAITTAQVGTAYSYDVNANDPDGDTLDYSLISKPTGMIINSVNGLISWTPAATGTFNVVVSVTDSSLSATQGFTITVSTAPNSAPVWIEVPADQTIDEDTPLSYDVNATDPDGDTVLYSLNDTSVFNIDSNGLITGTPPGNWSGTFYLRITASDGSLDVTADVAITVNAVNDPPYVFAPLPDVNFSEGGSDASTNMSYYFRDVDSPTLIWGYEYTNDTSVYIAFTPDNFANITRPLGWIGPVDIILLADDGQYVAGDTITVTVYGTNQPPVADFASNAPVDEGTNAIFTDSSTDSDGTIVSWAWSFGDSSTSTLQNPSHLYTGNGTYSVNLTVTDNDGSESSIIKEITVDDLAPVANFSASTYVAAVNQTIFFTDLSTFVVDPLANWSWNFDDGTGTFISQNINHKFENVGFYNVTLTVTDSDGSQDMTVKAIEVKNANLYGTVYDTNTGSVIAGANVSFYSNSVCSIDEMSLVESGNCTLDPKAIPDATTDANGTYFAYLTNGFYQMIIQHSKQVERNVKANESKQTKVDPEMKENAGKNINFEGHVIKGGEYRDDNKYVMGDTLTFVMFGINHDSQPETVTYMIERHVSDVDNGTNGHWIYNGSLSNVDETLIVPANGSKVSKIFNVLIDDRFTMAGRYDIHVLMNESELLNKWHKIGNFFIMENVTSVTRTPPTVKFYKDDWYPDDLMINREVYVNESFNATVKVEVHPQDGTITGRILYILPITDPVNCTFAAEGDEVTIKAPGSVITVNNTNYTDEFVANVTNARGKDGCVIHSDFVYDESDNFLANFTVKERYYGAESTLKQVNATIWATEQQARDIWYDISQRFGFPVRAPANFSGHFRNITQLTGGIPSDCINTNNSHQPESYDSPGWYNLTLDYKCSGALGFEYMSTEEGYDGVGDMSTIVPSGTVCSPSVGDNISISKDGATLCEKRIMDWKWQGLPQGDPQALLTGPETAEELADIITNYWAHNIAEGVTS